MVLVGASRGLLAVNLAQAPWGVAGGGGRGWSRPGGGYLCIYLSLIITLNLV